MAQQQRTLLTGGRAAVALAVVALALAVGYAVRQSDKPAQPTSSAPAAETPDRISALEEAARNRPDDAAAWAALGAAYFENGRFEDAAEAYQRAAAAAPNTPSTWSALGEALVMASKREPMPAAAAAAFERAVALDVNDPRARYFMAVRKDLAGDHQGAIADWLGLLADTPPGAPWEADLRRTIEQVGRINRIDVGSRLAAVRQTAPAAPPIARAIPGPSANELRAASAIPPSEQRQMAEAMVARLEQRLRSNPTNVDGWLMLMRSRMTLGEPAKAAQALHDAIAANPAQTALLRQQAQMLGIR